jgi:hypothetical protein
MSESMADFEQNSVILSRREGFVVFVFLQLRRMEISGTLDPVCNLTGLSHLGLFRNKIGGMSVCVAIEMGCCCRCWSVSVSNAYGVSWQHRPVISFWTITSHDRAVWMVMRMAVVWMLGQCGQHGRLLFSPQPLSHRVLCYALRCCRAMWAWLLDHSGYLRR